MWVAGTGHGPRKAPGVTPGQRGGHGAGLGGLGECRGLRGAGPEARKQGGLVCPRHRPRAGAWLAGPRKAAPHTMDLCSLRGHVSPATPESSAGTSSSTGRPWGHCGRGCQRFNHR